MNPFRHRPSGGSLPPRPPGDHVPVKLSNARAAFLDRPSTAADMNALTAGEIGFEVDDFAGFLARVDAEVDAITPEQHAASLSRILRENGLRQDSSGRLVRDDTSHEQS